MMRKLGESSMLDATAARTREGGPSFGLRHRLFRAIWNTTWFALAAWTPAPLHRWRILLLRIFGANIAWTAHVYSSVRIWYPPNLSMERFSCLGPRVTCYAMAPIRIGPFTVVSQGAHLCAGTHDIHDPAFQITARPISIGSDVWLAAECFVGPGVTIGDGAILAARAVAFHDLAARSIYLGNPATMVRKREMAYQQ